MIISAQGGCVGILGAAAFLDTALDTADLAEADFLAVDMGADEERESCSAV